MMPRDESEAIRYAEHALAGTRRIQNLSNDRESRVTATNVANSLAIVLRRLKEP